MVWASRFLKKRILLIFWIVEIRWERKKVNSNGHNSSLGRPFDAIFFLNLRIFSISTQPNHRDAVCSCRFSQKRLLLFFLYERKYDEKIKRKFSWSGWVFQIDLEKIRGFKKKIASNGRSSRKLRPFEIQHLKERRWLWIYATSNGHNSGLGCPFKAIFFLNSRIFSRSTQQNCLKAVCACQFSQKRLLLIPIRVEKWWKK